MHTIKKKTTRESTGVAFMGLYQVYATFLDSVERVLEKYGPSITVLAESDSDFMANPRPEEVW